MRIRLLHLTAPVLAAPVLVALAALAFALAAPAPAAAGELAGVTLPDQTSAGGHDLVLNGMGLRKKLFIKVYVGGLYLAEKSASADQVLAADGARIMSFAFLYGVDKEQLCDSWSEGLEANTPDAPAEVKAGFETLCGWMEAIDKGKGMKLTYIPGTGTQVQVNGQDKGTIEGKAFADAVLRTWIGPAPGPGEEFKKAVLGG